MEFIPVSKVHIQFSKFSKLCYVHLQNTTLNEVMYGDIGIMEEPPLLKNKSNHVLLYLISTSKEQTKTGQAGSREQTQEQSRDKYQSLRAISC